MSAPPAKCPLAPTSSPRLHSDASSARCTDDAILPCNNTQPTATLKGQTCLPYGYDASLYTKANYTGVLPYQAFRMSKYMDGFAKGNLQVIREHPELDDTHGKAENEVLKYRDHPNMLAWYLYGTPSCCCPNSFSRPLCALELLPGPLES